MLYKILDVLLVVLLEDPFPNIDPTRAFVSGLHACDAMAYRLLATYPEVFVGEAIIAGLPHVAASTMPEAFDGMRGHGLPSADALAATVRAASKHEGPWPTVAVWHGSADNTIVEANAWSIIGRWQGVHALGAQPSQITEVDGQARRAWKDAFGRDVIKYYHIKGMAHGTPLDTATATATSRPTFLMSASRPQCISRGTGD